MVKDIIVSALFMLNFENEASQIANSGGTNEMAEKLLRCFNLVVSEVAHEYRREAEVKTSYGLADDEPEFYGIAPRVLAYGAAAEYCITEGLEDAATWDKRYKDGLSQSKKPPAKIKGRTFFGGE